VGLFLATKMGGRFRKFNFFGNSTERHQESRISGKNMGDYPDAMFVVDMQEQVIDYNPACLELLGLADEEWSGRAVEQLCAGIPELLSAVRYGTESGQYVLVRDGEFRRLLRVTTAVLKQPDGSPAGKLVVLRKVTTGSLGLRQEEGTARIRASLLFEMVPSALLTVNQRGLITYINPAALAVMGFSQEEILGQPCHNFMNQECLESCWLNHPEQAAPARGVKCHLQTKSGESRTILKNVELLRSTSGTVIGALESFEDITERERLENDLRWSEARYRTLFSNMQTGFGLYELIVSESGQPLDFRILEINPAFQRVLAEWSANPIGKRLSQVFPASAANFIRRYAPVASGGGPLQLEEFVPEIQRYFNILAYSPEGNQLAILLEDITALKSAEAERAAAIQTIYAMREISLEAVARQEPAAVAELLLELLDRILPFEAAFIFLVEPHSLKLQHQIYREAESNRRSLNGSGLDDQWLFTRMATSTRPLVIPDVLREPEWQAAPGQDEIRSFAGVPILIRDELVGFICCESQTPGFYRMEAAQNPLKNIAALAALALDNARRSGEQQYLALYDPLTGLANQIIFNALFEHTLQLARRQRTILAVLFIDLVGFKAVNDVFGRERGDLVLRSVAERLKECLRESDIVARLGEDEFIVVLENIARDEDAQLVARKLSRVLTEPHVIQGQDVVVQASSGVAIFPGDGENPEDLLNAARLALAARREQHTR
jgi:diguanylate cyclase (GGDEF)-like protein/PAS domain S-box-containing protein